MPPIVKELPDLEIQQGLDQLTPSRIATLYRRAPLLRPVSDPARLWAMFERSSLVLSAWSEGRLVGIARVLTDGVVFSYLCDLAVEPDLQRLGIGRRLMDEVYRLCKGTELYLRDATGGPTAYFKRAGFAEADNTWVKKL